jgi:hypothetical protein
MAINTIPLTINTVPKPLTLTVDLQTGAVDIRYDVNTDDGRPERQGLPIAIPFTQLSGGEQAVVTGQIKPFAEGKINADWAARVASKT